MDQSRPVATTASQRSQIVRNLTPRELEIMRMLADDMTNMEIAEELGIAYQTVKNNQRDLHKILSIRSAAGLVAYLFRQRVLT